MTELEILEIQEADGVRKLALGLADGHVIESVVLPMPTKATICVSCQVGCRMGCQFCETARMGFVRNLTAREIVEQVQLAKKRLNLDIRNVVFMGMGEPLDNTSNIVQAIRTLNDQRQMDIPLRRMTVSTVGLPEGLDKLARAGLPNLRLSVSLNAADEDLRSALMPINRQVSLARLQQALLAFPLRKKQGIIISYVVMAGLNDTPDCAIKLADWLAPLPAKVNLIPYNPGLANTYQVPLEAQIDRFRAVLIQKGVNAQKRVPRGTRIMAGCGQLGGRYARRAGFDQMR